MHFRPTWSPNGRKIAFVREREGKQPEIFAMKADGSSQVNLTRHPAFDFAPDWQPLR